MSALLVRIIGVSNEVMVVLGNYRFFPNVSVALCLVSFFSKSFLNLKNIKVLHEAQLSLRARLFHVSGMHFQ